MSKLRDRAPRDAFPVLVRFASGESLANLIGAFIVFLYAGFVVPDVPLGPGQERRSALELNAALLGAYLVAAFGIGALWSTWRFRPVLQWLRSGRGPTEEQRTCVLEAPRRQLLVNATLWAVAAVLFASVNLRYSWELARNVGLAVVIGAVTTCALGYLVAQQVVRPLVGAVLQGRPPSQPGRRPQLFSRILMAWAAGSAVPLLAIGLAVIVREEPNLPANAPVLFLVCVGVLFGAFMTVTTARSIATPLKQVRDAVTGVAEGDLDIAVPVDDPSELGLLQAGVNRMTAGLRERQQLQDLFGRQVGEDVARQALERGVRLGGEEREVAVLFVDVVGSTQMAVDRPAEEVVEILNEFFTRVVDVVGSHGGFVNKFQGDAALAVFGAPVPRPDASACALESARLLRRRLREVEALRAGIGVSAGTVVAGNVGAQERFEYTVIGDAVNEAARLTELAKQTEHGVLASGRAVQDAGDAEAGNWRRLGQVRLRGRTRETTVYGPSRSAVWEDE